jgi:hypothetical protein
MRTWTEQHSEGTDIGPVEWAHPFVKEAERFGLTEAALREIEAHPSDWTVTRDGGWPGKVYHRVFKVCMYDGWPYWRPGPAVLVEGTLGPEWIWFNSLVDARRIEAKAATP